MRFAIGYFFKALTRRVKPYRRKGKPVIGYVQRGKVGRPKIKDTIRRAKQIFTSQYKRLHNWSMQSVIHQINLGQHIGSLDDAHIAGMEAAFEALRKYKPSM